MEKRIEILSSFYGQFDEDARLSSSRQTQLEFLTTMHYIHRHAPAGGKLLEIGAGTGRYSLALGICASLFGAAMGVIIGSIGGYFGGVTETVIMRFMDVWSALPGTMLCILVSNAMGSGFFATVIALTVGGIPGTVRMIRGQILSERSKEYIEAAQSINCSSATIMFKHLLPNVIQPVIVTTTMGIGSTMIMAASLSYIGLGIQPPNPEWGAMLTEGRTYIRTNPHLLLVPGIAIALTVFAINLMGDGVRDALDPKLRD